MNVTSINPTVSSVSNSTSETDLLAVTIPANSLADGDYLELSAHYKHENNSGSVAHLTERLRFGGGSSLLMNNAAVSNGQAAEEFGSIKLLREGADLIIVKFPVALGGATWGRTQARWTPDFTVDNDLRFTAQWDTANANISSVGYSGKLVQY